MKIQLKVFIPLIWDIEIDYDKGIKEIKEESLSISFDHLTLSLPKEKKDENGIY